MAEIKKIPVVVLSDEELMQAVCKGNRNAFEQLYDGYFDKLVWFARGFLNDEQKAEDAVQEVFMRIIERPEAFDASKKFSTWVYTLTGNYCKNVLRNDQNRQRLLQQDVFPLQNSSHEMHHESDLKLLQQCIKKIHEQLSEKEKNIYTLRFEEELSIKEIAEIIDIPEGSVKSGIYYLLKKFEVHLKPFTHAK